ncbi:tyrosine-type recombinase/integrase [Fuscibacter oryzae]|uniref:Integrase family protein n=1 Tax=Fuscibacter oryzae TaxID=2803939 RepID=A0A8J7MPS1_9RHOB|nr:integrase family protein [Fuscibacter oryzae]MBL4927768.1 integrase family protein [Fuscibacter oryzae]
MPQTKSTLSDAALRKLKPTGVRHEINDSVAVGLRARVSAEGRVTFILKAKDAANKLQTITLGAYPHMSLKEAREGANQARLNLKAGKDINQEKRQIRRAGAAESEEVTLRDLLGEFETRFASSKKTWAPRGPRSERSGARQVIERVYKELLDRRVVTITDEEFAHATTGYKRAKPKDGKLTANGQASRARGYLGPVLDWAAGRKIYAKIGASRLPRLGVVSLVTTHDPASDDPTIAGKRTRVLTEAELKAVLPYLVYPAPKVGSLRLEASRDYRPIAMRFLLFTAARLEEVCAMRWKHLDRLNKVWHKPSVKSTKGGSRSQNLPLSDAAMSILRGLPDWECAKPTDLVFPNATGERKLGNWTRYQKALHEVTSTNGWHRHDLRRTAATIMMSLKVPASTIEHILAHADPLKADNVGGSASHYLQLTRVLSNTRDPQEEALAVLGEALELIEFGAPVKRKQMAR